jgi:8-oxo-dGTP pyrophosphatase MutT (NUDIX family)
MTKPRHTRTNSSKLYYHKQDRGRTDAILNKYMKAVAKTLLYDAAENILVLYRSDTHPKFPHDIDLPGGEIDEGESALDAAIREVAEEAGLIIDPLKTKLVGERTTPYGRIDQVYVSKIDEITPPVTISWEHESYDWIPAHTLSTALATTQDDYMSVVAEYLKRI